MKYILIVKGFSVTTRSYESHKKFLTKRLVKSTTQDLKRLKNLMAL